MVPRRLCAVARSHRRIEDDSLCASRVDYGLRRAQNGGSEGDGGRTSHGKMPCIVVARPCRRENVPRRSGGCGTGAKQVSRASNTFHCIGLDVGGTKIAAGLIEFPGGG